MRTSASAVPPDWFVAHCTLKHSLRGGTDRFFPLSSFLIPFFSPTKLIDTGLPALTMLSSTSLQKSEGDHVSSGLDGPNSVKCTLSTVPIIAHGVLESSSSPPVVPRGTFVHASAPARIDLAGGWSDTIPIT